MILVGATVRITLLTANRLHPDEALFATLARLIVSGRDPWLSETPLLVDKPPLFYYVVAGSVTAVGGSEMAVRLPGLFAGLISLALTARLAWRLWHSQVALALSVCFYALSPFAILFAPTVFADPQLMMWLLAALVAVVEGKWGLGGVLFGFALATKQSALFFAPLILALGAVYRVRGKTRWREIWGCMWRFCAGLAVVAVLMVAWDAGRQAGVTAWVASIRVNNPGRLIRSDEVRSRARVWLSLVGFMGGSHSLNVVLAGTLLTLAPIEIAFHRRTRAAASTLVLLAFVVIYLGMQWLVAFPILDRYLLPVVPLLALLIARGGELLVAGLSHALSWNRPILVCASCLVLATMLACPAYRAARGAYPVGGDHGSYDGIDRVAAYLSELPVGAVVYYDVLGWSLNYYLFDAYLYLAPIDGPAALAADLLTFGGEGPSRYMVLAGWESHTELLDAVDRTGYRAVAVFETDDRLGQRSFVVYQIVE